MRSRQGGAEGSAAGELSALRRPAVAAQSSGGDCECAVAADQMDGGAAPAGVRGLGDQIEQFGGAAGLGFLEEHRLRGVEDEVDDRPDLLAVEFHRVVAGAGVRLPVDVARVVAGHVSAVVLEIERRAGAGADEFASLAFPDARPQGQTQPAGGGQRAACGRLGGGWTRLLSN